MWSEHCGYKHSKNLLKKLPVTGPRILVGPGENAGVVDIGDGLGVAFKIESHNHPCAVEPYEAAGTGVGGIVRDILAMGSRPVALAGSFRFGPPDAERSRFLFCRAIAGATAYGDALAFLRSVLRLCSHNRMPTTLSVTCCAPVSCVTTNSARAWPRAWAMWS